MIAIAAVKGKDYREWAAEDGMSGGEICLSAADSSRCIGRIWYRVEKESGQAELLLLAAQEEVIREGLVRAALNAAELAGAQTAVCRRPEMTPLLERLGFLREKEGWSVSIPAFFSRTCRSEKQQNMG